MDRVIVSRPMIGLTHMQVCCVKDATREEILLEANKQNTCGTERGWLVALLTKEDTGNEEHLPVECEIHPERHHVLVHC